MIEDLENVLSQLSPKGSPAELRAGVLQAVSQELAASQTRPAPPWGWAVAASVLLGLGLNYLVYEMDQMQMARIHGSATLPRRMVELVEAVESVTDAETARWVKEQASAAVRRTSPSYADYLRMILEKEWPVRRDSDEEFLENRDSGRGHRRGSGTHDLVRHYL